MARLIEIISTSEGIHHLEIGMNHDEEADFSMQLWITHYGQRTVDWVQAIGMNFISFMEGDLWIHNSDDVPRANLFGEQKDYIVGVVPNENPTAIKLFDALGIHSDGQWEVSQIVIPPSLNYPNGMESKIPAELFKMRDGVWRARFLRNMKTTSDTASVIEALRGEPLRGYQAYLILKNVNNPDGEQVKLFKVQCEFTSTRV